MGRKKGSGGGFTKSLTISVSPAQREFLSRKIAGTGATVAGYIRVLIDKDMARKQKTETGKEVEND